METAEPRIYQLHMKDLEYKKKALLANEKNIFKHPKQSYKNLIHVESSRSVESVRSDVVVKNSDNHIQNRKVKKILSKNTTNVLYNSLGDNTQEPTAEGTEKMDSNRATKVQFDIHTPEILIE